MVVRARATASGAGVVALGVAFTVVGLVLGVPIWIVATKLPVRAAKAGQPA